MSAAGFRALVGEVRSVGTTLTTEVDPASVGPIAVSGMLAEQLAKELSAGAEAGAVVVGGAELAGRAEVLVRIVAGDPSSDDEQLVRAADSRGVPVVVVQLWPQADWTMPFVLTPFVVECRAGEGFPVREIADRIVESTESGAVLASRAPQLAEAARVSFVKSAVIRSALIGLAGSRLGASRPLLSLEQVRLLSQLRVMSVGPGDRGRATRSRGRGCRRPRGRIRVSRHRTQPPHGCSGAARQRGRRGGGHVDAREGVPGRRAAPALTGRSSAECDDATATAKRPRGESVRTWT